MDETAPPLRHCADARSDHCASSLRHLVPTEGGTFVVPVTINGKITVDFSLNSGAAEVTIPADLFETLRRTGTISEADLLEPDEYQLADGSTREQTRFLIRTLKVGEAELQDVLTSVSPIKGYLVLGQSFLSRVGTLTWSVDNQRHMLVLNGSIASAPRSESGDGEGAPAGLPDMSDQVTELIRPRRAAQTTTQGR